MIVAATRCLIPCKYDVLFGMLFKLMKVCVTTGIAGAGNGFYETGACSPYASFASFASFAS